MILAIIVVGALLAINIRAISPSFFNDVFFTLFWTAILWGFLALLIGGIVCVLT